MTSSFSPRTILTLILPGAIFLMALAFIFKEDALYQIEALPKSAASILTSAAFITAFLLASFFLGSFFDSIRNLVDSSLDKGSNWWDFFFKGEKEKVEQMDGYYFSYYQFDANAAIAIFILLFVLLCSGQFCFRWIWIIT